MTAFPTWLSLGALAYLLGAIPSGLLISRACGVDIRRVGSGNIGATNVFRCVGKGWGVLTFACDAFKGFAAAFLLPRLGAWLGDPVEEGIRIPLFCACLSVVGHNWPVFLRFKGGKGVAATVGALLGIAPGATGAGFLLWTFTFLLSRYVSLASIVSAGGAAAFAWAARSPGETLLPSVITALAALIGWRHKANIRRLLDGSEHRFSFGGKK